ncbi:MAG: lysophospholipid acyltransferase family protein [Promethearchaeota archaeon]|jgi:KDO2-lipid IV(A) lauroyltransferase
MKNKLEYILFRLFSSFFQLLGLNIARRSASILAFLFFYFIPIRKKTVIDNLTIAFPDYDYNRIKRMAFNNYKSFAITFIEILFLPKMNREEIKQTIKYSNIQFVKEKYDLGKGLILLTAHFGNWEYAATSFGVLLGIPLSVIVKPLRNPFVDDRMNRMRTKWGNEVVALGVSIRKTYQTLKEKKIVAIAADQRGPLEGTRVEFFGKDVSAFTGPAALALKTGAPILYAIAVRQKDFSYVSEFHEISTENLTGTEDDKITELTRRHMAQLEKFIRENPEQWLWMHKRWKH